MNSLTPLSNSKQILLGVQFLFVAFGATVLVPLLVGINPSIALLSAGVGTLIFHLITKGKVPVFLGSSFAFIAPITLATEKFGFAGTLSGIIAVGIVYSLVSFLIKLRGVKFIKKIFPSIVVGPVIMVIGLSLASTAVDMAKTNWTIAGISLLAAVISVVYFKGIIKLIPVFIGIIVGYLTSFAMGGIDFTPIQEAAWFQLPDVTWPTFSWEAILFMIPVAIAPLIEHVGDIYAISAIAEKDFIKDPGLNRTMLGDGIATSFAGLIGSVPNTTYSEVTGAIELTKVTNPRVLRIAAITAIVFSLIGKVSGFLKSIPTEVLGGIMLLLFGMISSVGIKTLIESKSDFHKTRNLVIVSIILTVGVGKASIDFGSFSLSGIGLASVVGVILNLILPGKSKEVHMDNTPEEN
ncbi:uracil-xanthine permease family protein [Plebeiibacterium sediminum]|uniref:NCS2 family nucleobase:cation symporter n=1 Tax=Plebeiibacterium sediminum TaxID=2992112 RepID=A0AAE3M6L1_9BACT|nr:solute carrier family 23 protein [Plebeiobacterium sediminum]MCW3788074.1 NCS2 family nucleobase:cation symporter [Plebeiobacterium sediminum]